MTLEDLHRVPIGLIMRILLHAFGNVEKYSDYLPGSENDDYNDAIRKIAESG